MAITILVVDDSRVEQVLIESLLRKNPAYRVQLAGNGQEALAAIAVSAPILVVTDLVMPEMDGLELTRTIRNRYAEIPVILMTAYGDESTAALALEAGATSYVPKAQKAERLMLAVERAAEYAVANRSREQLAQCMFEYHCRFALENDRRLIHALAAQIQQTMVGMRFSDTVESIRVSEALEEALLNAMYHGNLEISRSELAEVRAELDDGMLDRLVDERSKESRNCERRIVVIAHLTRSEARFVVRDEGRGFDIASVSGDAASDRFGTGQDRGMTLIHSMMDEVTFNKVGNELVMSKRIQAPVRGSCSV
jgi:CheY-like chemotaxis protein/anti-sigma regulatory factor (Ser/Thr protein kinase)